MYENKHTIHTTNLPATMFLRMWQKALPTITDCSGQSGKRTARQRYCFIEHTERQHESRIRVHTNVLSIALHQGK